MANGFWRGKHIHKRGWFDLLCLLPGSLTILTKGHPQRITGRTCWHWWTIKALWPSLSYHKNPGASIPTGRSPSASLHPTPLIFLTPPEWSQIIPNMWLHALLNHGFRGVFITGKGLVIWNLNRSISTGPLKKMSSIIETLWQDPLRLSGTTAYPHDWTLTKLSRFHHLAMIFLRLLHWPWNKQIYLALSRYKKVRAPPL